MMARMRPQLHRYIGLTALVLGILLVIDGILLAIWWPFKEKDLVRSLEHFSSGDVQIARFRRIYFPHPGYIAEQLTFARRANGRPVEIASIKKLAARASWFAMLSFTHRLAELRLQELHVTVPAVMPPPIPKFPSLKDKTTVTSLVADGSVLEVMSNSDASQPLRFEFPRLTLSNVEKSKSIDIQLFSKLPVPRGELAIRGRFGPIQGKNGKDTPLSGSFRLTRADLSTFHSIGGTLSSGGIFRGTLTHCDMRGSAWIPNFELASTGHPAGLRVRFHALVNGRKGDVSLQSAEVHAMHTSLAVQGAIAGSPGRQAKTVTLGFTANRARVEDLLWIFASAKRPALEGPITFQGEAVLPPGNEDFLRKVRLDGDFAIRDAEFEHGDTQGKVDELSKRARKKKNDPKGPDAPVVLSDLTGRVDLRNGTATLSDMIFTTPGATARGEGTYNLLTKWVDLHGQVAMQASLSKAAGGGLKSILLIPLDPFYKKKHAGAVLPVQIKGKFPRPAFKVSLTGKK